MKTQKTIFQTVLTILFSLMLSIPAIAQVTDPGSEPWYADGYGHFFVSVIAGILLAFAFQFILTNLAVALGINAMGDVRDMDRESGSSTSDSDDTPLGVKISSGFGLYMLVTMTISLFFASWIAVKLSLTPNNTIGFTLGLVVWAGYLLLGLYIDSKMISSLTGSIFNTIKDALGATTSAVGGMFGSKESSAEDTAKATVKAIHDEVMSEFDMSGIEEKLGEYVKKLEPQKMNMDNIHEELAELINDIQIKEKYSGEPGALKELVLEVASEQPNFTDENKKKLSDAFEKAKDIGQGEGSKADKVMAAVDQFAPGDEEQSKEYRSKIEQYLRETNREELNPDKLKDDLNEILNNPKAAPDVVMARASSIDRDTLKSLLSNMEGMTDEKADEYLNKATDVLDQIKSKASEMQDGSKQMSMEGTGTDMKSRTKQAVREWFDRMNQPELKYSNLKYDAKRILDDPKAAPSILKNRLQKMDRESLIALVSNNQRISRDQAERVVSKIEEGRDEVLHKVDEIENKVKEKMQQAKRETLLQVENARKTAAAAAWWMFIAAVVSGGASALGGMLA